MDESLITDRAELALKFLKFLVEDRPALYRHFTDDVRLEFPFARSVGLPSVVSGRADVEKYLDGVFSGIPGLKFSDVEAFPMLDSDKVLLTYKGRSESAGRPLYDQVYITIMEFSGDKLRLFKEYWDTAHVRDVLGDFLNN